MGRRRWVAAAAILVCALTAQASPALVNRAFAAPSPPPMPPGPPIAPPHVGPPPSEPYVPPAEPGRRPLDDVREEIDALYRKAASATDAYNLAAERTDLQSAEVVELTQELVKGQLRIDDLKRRAGAAAREQYRNGGLPPGTDLVLSGDPGLFLDGVGRIAQEQKATGDLLAELTRAQEDLQTYTQDASTQWQKLETNRAAREKAKKQIRRQIAAAEKLENSLKKAERTRLSRLEEDAAERAQHAWLSSGAVRDINRQASPQGRRAVEFAMRQIGKPYSWGAEGPDSYDCSGLTSQAWAAAGRPIPRTAAEQWRRLPRIGIDDIRPGDLIIYYGDASHVALYVGDGMIVQAPRPGRDVKLSGAGSMEILGVVRPDK